MSFIEVEYRITANNYCSVYLRILRTVKDIFIIVILVAVYDYNHFHCNRLFGCIIHCQLKYQQGTLRAITMSLLPSSKRYEYSIIVSPRLTSSELSIQ